MKTSGAQHPRVSVILPAHNAQETIGYALRSVLQERQVPLEVIVIDDGSEDRTAEVVAGIKDSRVRLIRQERRFQPGACNRGICEARGEYVAFQDADDEWLPGKLFRQTTLLDGHSEIDVVFCNAINCDLAAERQAEVFDQCKDVVASLPIEQIGRSEFVIVGNIQPFLLRRNFIISRATTLLRSSVFERYGFFDENLRSTDDLDLWLRIGASVRFAFLAEPLFRRIKREESVSAQGPQWLREVAKLWEKWYQLSFEDENLGHLSAQLSENLKATHRSWVKSHVKNWEWVCALRVFRSGIRYGLDGQSLLFLLAGVAGPFPFRVGSALCSTFRKQELLRRPKGV